MTDLCRDGGKSAYNEKTKSREIIDNYSICWYYKEGGMFFSKSKSEIEQFINDFCQKLPDTLKFFETVESTCSDPFTKYNWTSTCDPANYNETVFYGDYYCNMVDANTGEKCYKIFETANDSDVKKYYYYNYLINYQLPYSQWKPALCKSSQSCIEQLDVILKRKYNSGNYLYDGTTNNPVSCCGMDDGTIGNKCRYDRFKIVNKAETKDESNSFNSTSIPCDAIFYTALHASAIIPFVLYTWIKESKSIDSKLSKHNLEEPKEIKELFNDSYKPKIYNIILNQLDVKSINLLNIFIILSVPYGAALNPLLLDFC
ncbi:hypothetical protein PIROE2DRAFT_14820 [Piromyces sp. E2]|nr:hypothetical protein PIROE2DRAFT_14820 [Piromyces sp. E2]|eukprot:OUM59596.1 hypothetical protein PIROE2DRAFT_14820 [Piromyces sp. E2]